MNDTWNKAQEWEREWHSTCINSIGEELKQLVYAEHMGLVRTPNPKTPYSFNLQGKSILDIGSGPYSLLLKCENFSQSVVIDPLMDKFPDWVRKRYETHGLKFASSPGESFEFNKVFDEVWFYNVLEHTFNPEKICQNARKHGKIVRVFEWLDTRSNIGHPQTLTEQNLNGWLGGEGKVHFVDRNGASGKCYSGIFKGDHYEE